MALRVAVAVVGLAMVVAGAAIVARQQLPVVVEVGASSSVVAEWAAGKPVWVVNEGEQVLVLDAVNPHPWSGFEELVGWCQSAGGFQAWWDGSMFDKQGRWLSGPSPRDLDRYDVVGRQADTVALGAVVVSQGRSTGSEEPEGLSCRGDGNEGPDARYHDLTGSEREIFDGRIVAEPGAVPTFCGGDSKNAGCSAALRVVDVQPDIEEATVLVGRFLGRKRGGELRDVIYLPSHQPD